MESKHNYRSAVASVQTIFYFKKSQPDVNRNTVFKSQLMLRLREDTRQESKHV